VVANTRIIPIWPEREAAQLAIKNVGKVVELIAIIVV